MIPVSFISISQAYGVSVPATNPLFFNKLILKRKYIYGVGIDEVLCLTELELTADINQDGIVDEGDMNAMAQSWLKAQGGQSYDAASDLNRDGRVSNIDADILAEQWYNRNQGVERVVGRYYYHFDGLGSVSAVLDGSMAVVEYYTYDVYGSFRVHSPGSDGACFTADDTELAASSFDNPYGFTGRRWDAEIGLYHYRARMYNPAVGRFMQTDPIGYEDGLNWYAYVHNNPVNLMDPSGENVFGGFVSWIAGNGFDTNYDMGWKQAGQLGVGALEGGGKGAAAWADGAIPFADPFKGAYANADGSVDSVYRFSQSMGGVSRNAVIAAGVVGVWQAVGPTMNVAVGSSQGSLHVAYGTNGQWLHALAYTEPMTVTSVAASSFAASSTVYTFPTLSSSAILATEGMAAYNCVTAAVYAATVSGTIPLAVGGAAAITEPIWNGSSSGYGANYNRSSYSPKK